MCETLSFLDASSVHSSRSTSHTTSDGALRRPPDFSGAGNKQISSTRLHAAGSPGLGAEDPTLLHEQARDAVGGFAGTGSGVPSQAARCVVHQLQPCKRRRQRPVRCRSFRTYVRMCGYGAPCRKQLVRCALSMCRRLSTSSVIVLIKSSCSPKPDQHGAPVSPPMSLASSAPSSSSSTVLGRVFVGVASPTPSRRSSCRQVRLRV